MHAYVRRKSVALLLLVAGVLLTACGGSGSSPEIRATSAGATLSLIHSKGVEPSSTPSPHESPGDAVKRQFTLLSNGQFGREWDELHPGQQAIVSREKFTECASQVSITIDKVDVIETYDDPINVTGVAQKTSKAVTVRVTAGTQSDTQTFREVLADGSWRWVLGSDSVAAYQEGRCP